MIAKFSLQPETSSILVSIFAIAIVLVLAYWSWQRSGFHRGIGLLELLRIALVIGAVILLNQPETVQEFLPTQKPTVVVLGDQSKSMLTRDAGLDAGGKSALTTRGEAIAPLLDESLWQDVKEKFDMVIEPFAEGENSGETDLHAALQSAQREHVNLRAVLLASDGDWNSGKPPVDIATRLRLAQIPVFGVPVGSASRLPDVDLLSFDLPTSGVVGKTVRIPFTIESSLPRDHSVVVTMQSDDGQKVTQDVRISAMGRTNDAILWKPDATGEYEMTLTVPQHGDEQISDNNARTAAIKVSEEKLKVLVVEAYPRWEYRYLRNALSRDPGVEVSCLLFHPGLSKVGGGNKDYIKAFPEALEDLALYDVVFLGDVGVDSGQLTEEQCTLLKGLVQEQASGLVFMPGWKGNQLSLDETDLADLMPVTMDDSQPQGWGAQTPGHFALTELGRRSLLTKLADTADENMQVWESLPGFQWYAPVTRAKAGCDVLAVHQDQSNEYGRLPLLVTKTSGYGKVLFMGTDGAWRWRRGVEDKYHYRFWGQVVRWMAYRRNMDKAESMRFFYTPEPPKVRGTISLSVIAMERSGEPLANGTVSARIVAPSGETQTVRMKKVGEQWGAFGGSFTPSEPGRHQVTLRCVETQAVLQTKLDVQGATLERIGKPSRPEVLEELARVTRGQVLKANDVDKIVQAISDVPPPSAQIRRVQLWSHPMVAALMIGLLGLFWVGRKMVGVI